MELHSYASCFLSVPATWVMRRIKARSKGAKQVAGQCITSSTKCNILGSSLKIESLSAAIKVGTALIPYLFFDFLITCELPYLNRGDPSLQ